LRVLGLGTVLPSEGEPESAIGGHIFVLQG
jgi:hypothetical protein